MFLRLFLELGSPDRKQLEIWQNLADFDAVIFAPTAIPTDIGCHYLYHSIARDSRYKSITHRQAEYRYDGGLYLRSTSILKTFVGSQL